MTPWTLPELQILTRARTPSEARRMLRLAGYVRSQNAVNTRLRLAKEKR